MWRMLLESGTSFCASLHASRCCCCRGSSDGDKSLTSRGLAWKESISWIRWLQECWFLRNWFWQDLTLKWPLESTVKSWDNSSRKSIFFPSQDGDSIYLTNTNLKLSRRMRWAYKKNPSSAWSTLFPLHQMSCSCRGKLRNISPETEIYRRCLYSSRHKKVKTNGIQT